MICAMRRVNVFTTKKHAIRYLYRCGYHYMTETDTLEIWSRYYNRSRTGRFRAYLECKSLLGANHNYKYECNSALSA